MLSTMDTLNIGFAFMYLFFTISYIIKKKYIIAMIWFMGFLLMLTNILL